MSRFYLTTAIDYVNSRPHLGTAYEKIAADVIARYKRLARLRHPFRHGQRRALAERVQEGARARRGPAGLLRSDGSRSSSDVWQRLDMSFDDFIRTTEPRHKAGVQELVQRITPPATSTRASTKAGTASAARPSSRRRISSTATVRLHRDRARVDPGEELLLPAVEVSASRCSITSLRTRSSSSPTSGATRSSGCSRAGWTTSRSAAPGSRGAFRCRGIRRASSTSGSTRSSTTRPRSGSAPTRDVREVVAGRSARHRQGHHALPCRDLAGDADERRSCRCRGRSSATAS